MRMPNMMPKALVGTVIILSSVFLIPALSGAKDDVIPSTWAPQPPKIDGASDDWTKTTLSRWDKGNVDFGFCNDAHNLYAILIFKNAKYLSTIERTGINLYFSAAGKKNKDYGILFRKKLVSAEETIAMIEKQKPLSEEQKAQLRTKPEYNIYHSEVINKNAGSKEIPPEETSRLALFRYAPQQKTLVYEFAVPLERVNELAAGVGVRPGEAVTVGFEWGGATEAQMKRAARMSGNVSIANEEVSRGSVEGIARPRGPSLPPKYSFWATVKLAASAE
jgi:hypothetical protein